MGELMKLDPSFQNKKSRRQSVEVYKKNCRGYPQPHDLESVGVEVPTSINFAHVLREQSILDDILIIVSKKVGTNAVILPRVNLSFISNMGCFLQLGDSNYRIPNNKTSEKIMDSYFENIFNSLKSYKDTLIGTLSFSNYDINTWERTNRSSKNKIMDNTLINELRKTKMENGTLKIEKNKEWYDQLTERYGIFVPWSIIEVGVSNFSMKRMSGHATMWTFRKNPSPKGKRFICSIYDSNGSVSFKSKYMDKLIDVLFKYSDLIDLYVIHLPRINTSDSSVIEDSFLKLGIKKSVTMNGYCSTLTLFLIMDVICTDKEVYNEGHFERLLNDLQKRNLKEPIEEKHKFATAIYGKHLSYIIVNKCIQEYKRMDKKPPWWNKFERQLGDWDSYEGVETCKIKRSVRSGVTKYKNMNTKEEIIF
jgi:hypothetical protein